VSLAADLADVRERTLTLVAPLPVEDLERQVDPLMSPLVWDLAHIAAYEDLWLVHRYAGEPLLHPELTAVYDAFETPRSVRGQIELLDAGEAFAYLDHVRARTLAVLGALGPHPVLHELVLRHELQHTETMLQAMRLGGLEVPALDGPPAMTAQPGWIDVPGGEAWIGADDGAWSYDNERPRHRVQLAPFRIARRPVSVAEFTGAGDADVPMCHVSWFEADALARWCGARLPTEAEWEKAADRLDSVGLVWEWTASPFTGYPGFRAHPYREYSEVFFGDTYRVLRGGSWATRPAALRNTFRNWDFPIRRQLFVGLRCAK
jgi:iron(II)-dependent oxidoreductase